MKPNQSLIDQAHNSPSEIPKILRENISFSEDINNDLLLATQILFGSDPGAEIEKVKNIKVSIGVCGQVIENYDILWFCKSCAVDPSSGLCQSCYENSVHTGHETFFRKGFIGVCDCGDPDAWSPAGFCKNHQGYDDKNITADLLPSYLREAAPAVFQFLGEELNRVALIVEHPKLESAGRCAAAVHQIVVYLSQMAELSAVFAKMVCDLMNSRLYALKPSDHVCNFRTFLSKTEEEKDKMDYEKKLAEAKAKDPEAKICECKLLENILKILHVLEKETLEVFCEFIVKMVKSPLLKEALGYGLLSNYKSMIMNTLYSRIQDEEPLEKVSLQVFTVDAVALQFLQNPQCRDAILQTFSELIDETKSWDKLAPHDIYVRLFTLRRDLHYFYKEKIMTYLVDETDMLEKMLRSFVTLEFSPLYPPLSEALEDQNLAGCPTQPHFDHYWQIIIKRFLTEIDYANDTQCRRYGLLFASLLRQQLDKLKKIAGYTEGTMYHATQFHRAFQRFVTTLVHARLARNWTHPMATAELREEIRTVLKTFLTESGKGEELDELIEVVLEVALTPLLFMIEIKNNEWTSYAGYLEGMAVYYYKEHQTSYFIPDASLVQLLLGIYDGPNKASTLELIMRLQSNSKAIKTLSDTIKNLDSESDIKVEEKDRQLIEKLLHLLCYLCSDNTLLLLPLIRLYYPLPTSREYLKSLKQVAERARNYYFSKKVVQFAMKSPRFNHNTLFKSLSKKIAKSKELDSLLMEMCDTVKNAKGQVQFTLKPEKCHLFDPYCYPSEVDVSLSLDACSQYFKKFPFDAVFGAMPLGEKDEKPPIELNKLFIERMMDQNLIKLIINIVKKKESSETMKLSAFKLLFTFASFSNESSNKSLSDTFEANGDKIFEAINSYSATNDMQRYGFNRLAKELSAVQPTLSKHLASLEPSEEQKELKVDAKEKQRKIMEEFKK
eukprot:TRINITY_DN4923_c0_g3_i1.p1 TRINITY_DN4923_c0_g3~~TRINITY_DN4923_c0_g3_i1.p1  ORF type:complete len:950 (-),score=315.52 TRINITY_DN4923_c0_g3_i1:1529-4378(-)